MKNITAGLIQPFTQGTPEQPNATYTLITEKISQLNIDNQSLADMVESVVNESLEALSKQVKIKQWQIIMQQNDQLNESVKE